VRGKESGKSRFAGDDDDDDDDDDRPTTASEQAPARLRPRTGADGL